MASIRKRFVLVFGEKMFYFEFFARCSSWGAIRFELILVEKCALTK